MITIAFTRGRRGLCVSALALVFFATLAIQAAQASTIHACVKPKSGATRIVSAKTTCHHGEQKLAWSTTGQAGPQGSAGPHGSAGPQGSEGKAGTNGAGALFSASLGRIELKLTESVTFTKTVPPGSYMIWVKSDFVAESNKVGFEDSVCLLEDRPGTTNTGETELLDAGAWAGELGEEAAAEFFGEGAIPMQATLTSSVTSTLSVTCFEDHETPGVKVQLARAQLQALAVTSIG
jgi:hypothetical protein